MRHLPHPVQTAEGKGQMQPSGGCVSGVESLFLRDEPTCIFKEAAWTRSTDAAGSGNRSHALDGRPRAPGGGGAGTGCRGRALRSGAGLSRQADRGEGAARWPGSRAAAERSATASAHSFPCRLDYSDPLPRASSSVSVASNIERDSDGASQLPPMRISVVLRRTGTRWDGLPPASGFP